MTSDRPRGRPRKYFPLTESDIRSMVERNLFVPGIRQKPPFTNQGISYKGSLLLIPPDDARWNQKTRHPLRRLEALDFLTRIQQRGLIVVGTSDLQKCRISYDPRLPRPIRPFGKTRRQRRRRVS